MLWRLFGGLMVIYAAAYVVQFVFSSLYENPQRVWDVMNAVSAFFILSALVLNYSHRARTPEASILAAAGAHALFYVNAVLAIWFFRNWVGLLALEEGESVSTHADVIWYVVAALIPVVLTATGSRLLKS